MSTAITSICKLRSMTVATFSTRQPSYIMFPTWRMNYAATIKVANDLTRELPSLGSSTSHQDYEDALGLVEYLIEHDSDSPRAEELTHLV